jgi:hypothetical protein
LRFCCGHAGTRQSGRRGDDKSIRRQAEIKLKGPGPACVDMPPVASSHLGIVFIVMKMQEETR